MNKKIIIIGACFVVIFAAMSAAGTVNNQLKTNNKLELVNDFAYSDTSTLTIPDQPSIGYDVCDEEESDDVSCYIRKTEPYRGIDLDIKPKVDEVTIEDVEEVADDHSENSDFEIRFITSSVKVSYGEIAKFVAIVTDNRPSVVPDDTPDGTYRYIQKYNTKKTYCVNDKKYDIKLVADDCDSPRMIVNGEKTPHLIDATSLVLEDSSRIVFHEVIDQDECMDFEIKTAVEPAIAIVGTYDHSPKTFNIRVGEIVFDYELSGDQLRIMPDASVEIHLFIDTNSPIYEQSSQLDNNYKITLYAESNGITKTASSILYIDE